MFIKLLSLDYVLCDSVFTQDIYRFQNFFQSLRHLFVLNVFVCIFVVDLCIFKIFLQNQINLFQFNRLYDSSPRSYAYSAKLLGKITPKPINLDNFLKPAIYQFIIK